MGSLTSMSLAEIAKKGKQFTWREMIKQKTGGK
jgi:hypothetical protein